MVSTVHTLKPSLTQAQGLSNWQKVVNQAGYAPSKADIRAAAAHNIIGEHKYVHTEAAKLLSATRAVKAKLASAEQPSVRSQTEINPARGTTKKVKVEVETRQETQRQLKGDFLNHYGQELGRLMDEIPPRFWKPGGPTKASVEIQTRNQLDLLAKAHYPKEGLEPASAVRDKILKASIAGEKLLLDLREQFSDDLDKAPQLFANKGKFTVIRSAPPLENLALRGGGTKGIGYIGEVRALEKQGVIKKLGHIAGTSAGALTASLIAGGLSSEKFAEVSRSRSPMQMARGTDREVDTQFRSGIFSASAVVSLIDGAIKESMRDFLGADPAPDLSALSPQEQQALSDLAKAPTNTPVTFKHLSWLAKAAPERFKNLTLAVFDATDNRTKHIQAKDYPDWPIGETARMSMAIPVVFKAVQGPDGHKYQDGGLGSNMPSEVFVRPDADAVPSALTTNNMGDSKWTPAMQDHLNGLVKSADGGPAPTEAEQADNAAKTLLISFDEGGKFHQIVNHGKLFSKPSAVKAAFGASGEVTAADRLKVYSAGPNAMAAYHGTLDTQSFGASQRKLDLVELFSEAKALEQVRQQLPMDRATYEVHDSLRSALQALTTDEVKLLREACLDRIAGNREITGVKPLDQAPDLEVPDLELLQAADEELALRSSNAPMTEEQINTVPGLSDTTRRIKAELAAATLAAPGLLTPHQRQLLSAGAADPQSLQQLILKEHLLQTLQNGVEGLQHPLQEPIPAQGQQALEELNQAIALLKSSSEMVDAATLAAWCQMANAATLGQEALAWIALAEQIKAQAPSPPLVPERNPSAVGIHARQTMPRLIYEADRPVVEPVRARVRAQEGIEAAERAGVKKTSGWFARIARVTAGLIGMAGAAALAVLFPPAAPLIYLGALAVAAVTAQTLQRGQDRHLARSVMQGDLERQRQAAQAQNLA